MGGRRGGVDDYGWFYFFEDGAYGGWGGDVGVVVGCVWEAVVCCAEVEDGDGGGGGGEELGYYVLPEETAAADYEDGGCEF